MDREIFVDTSGFYALLVKRDNCHQAARDFMDEAAKCKVCFVTTDYVLDETATLLTVRGYTHLLRGFFDALSISTACRIEWTDATRFFETKMLFLKYLDHGWSFTDCLSIHVMRKLRLRQALTKDAHFTEAGLTVLLPNP